MTEDHSLPGGLTVGGSQSNATLYPRTNEVQGEWQNLPDRRDRFNAAFISHDLFAVVVVMITPQAPGRGWVCCLGCRGVAEPPPRAAQVYIQKYTSGAVSASEMGKVIS